MIDEKLHNNDIDGTENLQDFPRVVFIDEKSGNLKGVD